MTFRVSGWAGRDMTGAEKVSQFENAYVPSQILRDTIWIFKAGKPVFLLREPGGSSGAAGVHEDR